MQLRLGIFKLLLLGLLLSACQKDEDLREGRFITDLVGQADMVSGDGVDYQRELYYDLSSSSFRASNQRDIWHLAFSGDPDHPNIFVNASMLMAVAATGSTDFTQNFKASDYNFEYERPHQFYQHAWMHQDFRSNGEAGSMVFLINLGRDLQNQPQGYKKFQILNHNEGSFQCQLSDLDGSNLQSFDLQTSSRYNYQFVHFNRPDSLMNLEPPKEDWDLRFCKYMERLWDGQDTLDYSVTGVLINPYATEAALDTLLSTDSTVSFTNLKIEDFNLSLLSQRTNTIGHSWKYFDLDAGAFGVRTWRMYLLKDEQGQHYRLRFTGFYGSTGNKGAVSFEYLPI